MRRLIALGLFAAVAAQAAVVYKWTDADGVVHFSDQPEPGAEKIYTSSEALNRATPTRAGPGAGARAQKVIKPGLTYTVFSISSPSAEQTFIDEPVPVRLDLTPQLQRGHTLIWHLNGQAIADQQNNLQFSLTDMPRGAYTLSATIEDPENQESASAATVSFYVKQPTVLGPQHKNP
ncbi:MAG TPA: DUF4124 domain-containing protein [Steroidobacteraceae bacterium]|nr:DUF4124 domain-containing protein [Steroidobacteraceae bacterium]